MFRRQRRGTTTLSPLFPLLTRNFPEHLLSAALCNWPNKCGPQVTLVERTPQRRLSSARGGLARACAASVTVVAEELVCQEADRWTWAKSMLQIWSPGPAKCGRPEAGVATQTEKDYPFIIAHTSAPCQAARPHIFRDGGNPSPKPCKRTETAEKRLTSLPSARLAPRCGFREARVCEGRTTRCLGKAYSCFMLNCVLMAASTSAGRPGGSCARISSFTRAIARERVSFLLPSSHADRFWRSATCG